jgi:hypothetical protein
MWFHAYAKELLAANSAPSTSDPSFIAEINGVRWTGANMSSIGVKTFSQRGAWTDQGTHIDFNGLCGSHAEKLFT